MGTFGGVLEARQIDVNNGRLTADVTANCLGSNYVGSLNRLDNSHAAHRNESNRTLIDARAGRSATFPRSTRIQSRRGFRASSFIPDGNLRDNQRA